MEILALGGKMDKLEGLYIRNVEKYLEYMKAKLLSGATISDLGATHEQVLANTMSTYGERREMREEELHHVRVAIIFIASLITAASLADPNVECHSSLAMVLSLLFAYLGVYNLDSNEVQLHHIRMHQGLFASSRELSQTDRLTLDLILFERRKLFQVLDRYGEIHVVSVDELKLQIDSGIRKIVQRESWLNEKNAIRALAKGAEMGYDMKAKITKSMTGVATLVQRAETI